MKRVLDASALLTGRQFPGELATVPGVLRELQRHGMTPQLEAVLEAAGEVRAANFGPVMPSNGSLDSLSEQQLQMVLASL